MWADSLFFFPHDSPSSQSGQARVCVESPFSSLYQRQLLQLKRASRQMPSCLVWRRARLHLTHVAGESMPEGFPCMTDISVNLYVSVFFHATQSQKRSFVWESWRQGESCIDALHTFRQGSRNRWWTTVHTMKSIQIPKTTKECKKCFHRLLSAIEWFT